MSQITSHVLDTSRGKPVEGIQIVLYRLRDSEREEVAKGVTNMDGRVGSLLPPEKILEPGVYKLIFETWKYFEKQHLLSFYPTVEINFYISDQSHYHIPLLLSQYGYTTYRGS